MNDTTARPMCGPDNAPVDNLSFEGVERRYVNVFVVRLTLVYILLIACMLLIPLVWDVWWPAIVGAAVLAAAYAVNVALARRIYDFKGYALRPADISYRTGIFFTSIVTIPFSKIQQVSIRMNPVSRMFGLCYVDVVNGSQAAMNRLSIPGLTPERAERLKSLLINHADRRNV